MMRPLVVDRRPVAEARVATMRVVPAFDPLENRHAGFGVTSKSPTVKHLALGRGEKALSNCVVVGIAHQTHRRHDACFLAALAERVTRVLRSD